MVLLVLEFKLIKIDLTIDGQGHTLICLCDECNAFYLSCGTTIFKNLKMINGHNDDNYKDGHIHIEGSAQYTLRKFYFQ